MYHMENKDSRTKSEVRMLNGYRVVYKPDFYRSMKNDNWKGYVYEHIFIAEKMIGRPLRDEEVVHHLDGDRANNRVENLLVLEKSQHSKLHTWINAGAPGLKDLEMKGLNSGKPKVVRKQAQGCKKCGNTLQQKQKYYCSGNCAKESNRKVERPSLEQIEDDLKTMSFVAVGKKYGVSDNCIRKWIKGYKKLQRQS